MAVGIVVGISATDGCLDSDIVVAQPILPILKDFNLTIPYGVVVGRPCHLNSASTT